MAVVYQKSTGLTDVEMHYCPGCTHGVIHKLVADALVELDLLDNTVGVAPVGCSVFAYNYFNCDMHEAAHGRAPAVATGIKRVLPDNTVFTYQGDGDLAAIGTAEVIHAAMRDLRHDGRSDGADDAGRSESDDGSARTRSGALRSAASHGRDDRSNRRRGLQHESHRRRHAEHDESEKRDQKSVPDAARKEGIHLRRSPFDLPDKLGLDAGTVVELGQGHDDAGVPARRLQRHR